MKSVLIFLFVLILVICVATDVKVYVYNGHEFHNKVKRTKPESRDSFIFGYHRNDVLSMQIYLSFNKNVSVSTDMYVHYPPDNKVKRTKPESRDSFIFGYHRNQFISIYERVFDSLLKLSPKISSTGKKYYEVRRILKDKEIVIELRSNTTAGVFTRNQIVRAVDVTGLQNETKEFPYNDICLKDQWCVIEVDLFDSVKTESAAAAYVLPVTVICFIILLLVIYLIVKKYCHQGISVEKISQPVETMELDTKGTTNEIIYADLNLASGDRQRPRYNDETSPYAHVVGV